MGGTQIQEARDFAGQRSQPSQRCAGSRSGTIETLLIALMVAGCQQSTAPGSGTQTEDVAQQWAAARRLWFVEEQPAYEAWMAIAPDTPEGAEARALIAEAEPLYREALSVWPHDPQRGWELMDEALRRAPMVPDLYLPLARTVRRAGQDRPVARIMAANYYRQFLLRFPEHPQAERARRELREVDPSGVIPVRRGRPPPAPPAEVGTQVRTVSWPLLAALGALLLALGALTIQIVRARRALLSLPRLAERRPELHPAIAYLIGSLRHELLKHRIGAVGDAVKAFERGRASEEQSKFLHERLFGGQPLSAAWASHVAVFEQTLGLELDLRRDRHFRRAARAIQTIVKMERRLLAGDPKAARKVVAAVGDLRALDDHLSDLARRLVRTRVDASLLHEVVDQVRSEYVAGQVVLDELVIRSPDPAPMVEVFRIDLVLILKNVVRNAIVAVGRGESPRLLGLDVEIEIEATGEESVVIHVRDSSEELPETQELKDQPMDRGLGLVSAALARYRGAISVEPAEGEWAKSVAIRFFRAFGAEEQQQAA